jgi:hypothetical protein
MMYLITITDTPESPLDGGNVTINVQRIAAHDEANTPAQTIVTYLEKAIDLYIQTHDAKLAMPEAGTCLH